MTGRRRRRGENKPAAEPDAAFVVVADEQVKACVAAATTPRAVKEGYKTAVRDLRLRGCAAASAYRLSGPPPWPAFCAIRLAHNYRLVLSFPHPGEVALELLGPHTNKDDPTAVLAELFGLPPIDDLSAWRDEKDPSCCEPDGSSPGPSEPELRPTRSRGSR